MWRAQSLGRPAGRIKGGPWNGARLFGKSDAFGDANLLRRILFGELTYRWCLSAQLHAQRPSDPTSSPWEDAGCARRYGERGGAQSDKGQPALPYSYSCTLPYSYSCSLLHLYSCSLVHLRSIYDPRPQKRRDWQRSQRTNDRGQPPCSVAPSFCSLFRARLTVAADQAFPRVVVSPRSFASSASSR